MVVPAGEGLVTSSPVQPAPGEAWRGGQSRRAISGTVSAIMPGSAGSGWPGRERGLGTGAVPEQPCGDGADSRRALDQYGVAGDRGVEADLGLIEPEAVLATAECSSAGHLCPVARISRASVSGWP
jgi:hypothetical protein